VPVRYFITAIVLSLVLMMAGAAGYAQEETKLAGLQDDVMELLQKAGKATVAIHCKLEEDKSAAPGIPLRRPLHPVKAGSYFGSGAVISSDGLHTDFHERRSARKHGNKGEIP